MKPASGLRGSREPGDTMDLMRASEVAYRRLRDDIIQWRLEPGTPLGEVETAERIGVSRTPVREALSRLAAEGLVDTGTGRTARVSAHSRDSIQQLFELREALETQAARLAAKRRDAAVFESLRAEFLTTPPTTAAPDAPADDQRTYVLADALDAAIDDAADSAYLRTALRDLRGHLARVRRNAHSNPGRLERATAEHVLIIDAILAGDENLAAQATAVHLHNSLVNVLSTLAPNDN